MSIFQEAEHFQQVGVAGPVLKHRIKNRRSVATATGCNVTLQIHARVRDYSAAKSPLEELLMNTQSISRRHFAHLLGIGAAAAIVRPRITIAAEPAKPKTGMVRLSANENPYGPSATAHEAMKGAHGVCNRYPDEANNVLIDKIAKINNT